MVSMSFARNAALAISIALAPAAQAASFSTFYVFGDSLVDAGNISALTGGFVPNPSQGYFNGRFNDGYNYTDLLSISLFGAPTIASLKGGNSYAFGGARAVTNADFSPDLGVQLAAYTAKAAGIADPDALYVLNFGGNDLFALASGDIGARTPDQYKAQLISNYVGAVSSLNGLGARNILITGIPNATIPLAFAVEAELQAALDAVSLAPGTELYRYSFLNFFGRLAADPASVGLPLLRTDTTCLKANTPSPSIDCTGFFLFDDVHPTAAVQAAIARDIDRQFAITAVPETTTWAMMGFGFAVIGVVLRRRRPKLAAA